MYYRQTWTSDKMVRVRWFTRGGPLLLVLALLAGCGADGDADMGPPEGWQGTDTRWWRASLDTAGVFRDLETLDDMNLGGGEVVYAANQRLAEGGVAQAQVAGAVKRSLIRLYRNEPDVVDSLFTRFVMPKIEQTALTGDLGDYVERFQREGYETIRKYFREPMTALRLGEDVPVVYPDSLRRRQVSGTVHMQVYLNSEGEPMAVELLEGVHPVLDNSAMRAAVQMRWRPAYVLRTGRWREIPSWARYNVVFRQQPS